MASRFLKFKNQFKDTFGSRVFVYGSTVFLGLNDSLSDKVIFYNENKNAVFTWSHVFIIAGVGLLLIDLWIALKDFRQGRKSSKAHLDSFMGNELLAFSQNTRLSSTERVSLYLHDQQAGMFRLLGRHSDHHRYASPGRKMYPDGQGIIGNAFQNDFCYEPNLPDPAADERLYIQEVSKLCAIPKDVIKSLRMKSRCLVGYAIRNLRNEKIGVLILETTKPDFSHIPLQGSTPTMQITLVESRIRDILERECNRLKYHIESMEAQKSIALAAQEGV
ncbi:MAG: hypothetical protein WDO70_12495 [Alphaproteobacteria bacterium]